jgi:hypothetical protein
MRIVAAGEHEPLLWTAQEVKRVKSIKNFKPFPEKTGVLLFRISHR